VLDLDLTKKYNEDSDNIALITDDEEKLKVYNKAKGYLTDCDSYEKDCDREHFDQTSTADSTTKEKCDKHQSNIKSLDFKPGDYYTAVLDSNCPKETRRLERVMMDKRILVDADDCKKAEINTKLFAASLSIADKASGIMSFVALGLAAAAMFL